MIDCLYCKTPQTYPISTDIEEPFKITKKKCRSCGRSWKDVEESNADCPLVELPGKEDKLISKQND